ncbi:ribosomal protein L7/L12 [Schlegelella sp. S2-27]|uniref:Ribosomal protein L7/L12 n=1 Tax=Caldimonas mangrovi TaxID=2944811 RepID=A0ABT0YW82_9BURK|nr:ribosomal protein L7/L12 [Caldimonas mangrovi]
MKPLPENVVEALEAGRTIEAIKRLRDATGVSLKEAKDEIDAHLQGSWTGTPAPRLSTPGLPLPVQQALQRGNKIEAIRLLREHTGLGLKEAKDRVEAAEASAGDASAGLAPGEVPRRAGAAWWWGVAALVTAALAYHLLS